MMQLLITDIGFDGEGVGRVDDKVCFVRFALVGEKVEVEPYQVHLKYIKAKLINIIQPSDKRIESPCPYFSQCGGCDFQHLGYQDELSIKKEILLRQLKKLGLDISIKVNASPKEFFYRNKVKMFSTEDGLAFHSAFDNSLVKIKKCLIASQQINKTVELLSQFLQKHNLLGKTEFVEIKEIDKTIVVNLFVKQALNADFNDFIKDFDCKIYIFQTENKQPRFIVGSGSCCRYAPNSFQQVNDDVAALLYQKVCSFAKEKTIANCYSGAGILSKMLLESGAKKVFGLELGKSEHNDAQSLKKQCKLSSMQNIQGDCAHTLPTIKDKVDLIVVDPPRAGCSKKVIQSINYSSAAELVYISCNHASFARDIGLLNNFQLDQIELFDMFPKTANFEIFAHLHRI